MNKEDVKQARFVYQDDQIMEKSFDWGVIRRLGTYVKPYFKELLPVIFITLLLGTGTKLAIPLLIGLAIDQAIEVGNSQKLLIFTGSMLVVYLIQWIVNFYRIRFTNIIGQKVI